MRPDVLIGTTGQLGSFDEPVIRAMAEGVERPVVFALSNPSSRVEADPGGHPDLERRACPHRHRQPLRPADVGGSRASRRPGQQRLHLPRRRTRRGGGGGAHHHRAHVPGGRPGPGGSRSATSASRMARSIHRWRRWPTSPAPWPWPWPRRPWRPGWPASARGPTSPPPSTRPCGTRPTCPTSAHAQRSTARKATPPTETGRRRGRRAALLRAQPPSSRGRSSRLTAPATPPSAQPLTPPVCRPEMR